MMLFWKKKARRIPDRVWMTRASKLRGIRDEWLNPPVPGDAAVLVLHFPRSLEELKEAFPGKDLDVLERPVDLSGDFLFRIRRDESRIVVLLSDLLQGDPAQMEFHENPAVRRLNILVAEHYPIPDRDDAVLALANVLPCKTSVAFHTSLEEPLLKRFGGDRLMSSLASLGLDKKEAIISAFTSGAIRKAQYRFKKQAIADQRTQSMEEWFQYNMPGST